MRALSAVGFGRSDTFHLRFDRPVVRQDKKALPVLEVDSDLALKLPIDEVMEQVTPEVINLHLPGLFMRHTDSFTVRTGDAYADHGTLTINSLPNDSEVKDWGMTVVEVNREQLGGRDSFVTRFKPSYAKERAL